MTATDGETRDGGLPKLLGTRELTIYYLSALVGAGILVVPGIALGIAGPASLVAWVVLWHRISRVSGRNGAPIVALVLAWLVYLADLLVLYLIGGDESSLIAFASATVVAHVLVRRPP